MLVPLEGMYTVKPEKAIHYSKLHMQYHFRIIDSKANGFVFIEPVKQDGATTSSRTIARLVGWASLNDLEKVDN
jgi:hypothetical protein